jgi:hypothetical protein
MLKKGDIVKLGRVQFKVKECQINGAKLEEGKVRELNSAM